METKKYSRPNSVDNKAREKPKPNSNTSAKVKRVLPSKDNRRSITPPSRLTLIPKLKSEGNKANASPTRNVKNTSSCFLGRKTQNEELDEKLRLLEAKEKSIAEYYEKIKDLNKKVLELQKGCLLFNGSKIPRATSSSATSFTPSLPSDTVALNQKEEKNGLLSSFEKSVHQISDIWLRTSLNLSNILSNFRSNSSLDTDQIQMEDSKIQLAIKQAKSLTLVKTKSVIAEAKKLLKEGVQNELDDHIEISKGDNDTDVYQSEEILREVKSEEGGDSKNVINKDCTSPTTGVEDSANSSAEPKEKKSTISYDPIQSANLELAKKNETIMLLNNKIFEFQKACNEHLLENSQLKYKIAEMNEKNQWNQVFWKQMSKLKDRIKILQQNNKQLEGQNKELESKIASMNLEVDKVTRLNHLLRQQINTWHWKQPNGTKEELKSGPEGGTDSNNTIVFREKEKIIEDLKNILILMRGQETFAHQKISEFETKIEEFKKYHS